MTKLVPTTDAHVQELMGWFPDQQSCIVWGSSDFRYPFTETTFREDIRLDLPSYSLIGNDAELLGFGQYYLRVGRCHLARLAISPTHRGQGLGTVMIHALCQRGCESLGVKQCSLFVRSDNASAILLYQRLGFAPTEYPGVMPNFGGGIYMTTSLETISTAAESR